MDSDKINKALIKRAIAALKYKARDIAGYSQGVDLIDAKDTKEWEDAVKLEEFLKQMMRGNNNVSK